MFNWLRNRRRQKIFRTPFPLSWRDIMREMVKHYSYLDHVEKNRLEQLVQIFIAEKNFEGQLLRCLLQGSVFLLILR